MLPIRPEYLTKLDQKRKPPYEYEYLYCNHFHRPFPNSLTYQQFPPPPCTYYTATCCCQSQVLSPQILLNKHRTTIRCPNKWLGNDCCEHVSTRRRLCGVAAQYCYRSYLGEPARRSVSSVTEYPLHPLPSKTGNTTALTPLYPAIFHRKGQVLPPTYFQRSIETTIRCPNQWLGNDCCAYVSMRRVLCGVAAQ